MTIIALSGYASAGKDSVADVLVAERAFKKYSWADTLRLAAAALNPIVWASMDGDTLRYNDAIKAVGYTEAKLLYGEVRSVLQKLGTEVGRNLIGDNVWVDATIRRIEQDSLLHGDVVIADTRFPNEAEAVKNLSSDNLVIRVTRPGVGPESDHASEISLDDYDFDFYFANSGDLGDLKAAVLNWYDSLEILC